MRPQYVLKKLHLLKVDTAQLVILNHISGVLKPGRLTLLLGPPSSGKSTLLKALANKLDDSGLYVSSFCSFFCSYNCICKMLYRLGDCLGLPIPSFASNLALHQELPCSRPGDLHWQSSIAAAALPLAACAFMQCPHAGSHHLSAQGIMTGPKP